MARLEIYGQAFSWEVVIALNKEQLEEMLVELDEALVAAFPGPEPIKVVVVGGACLVFAGVVDRRTKDIDVIITDFLGTGEVTLVYELDKPLKKLRRAIQTIGTKYGLRGDERMFLNDDCAPFLRELGDVPPVRLLRAYRKLHVYLPADLHYILACKLLAAREKDMEDIAALCQLLDVRSRALAQRTVDRYFPDPVMQMRIYNLPQTLDTLFGPR